MNEWITAGKKGKKVGKSEQPRTKPLTRKQAAIQRLKADWKELAKNPIPNCAAQPLESDIFEWHVNLKSTEEPLDGVVFHFILKFPETYPSRPPTVEMPTGLPHPNCIRLGGKNMICADMLETGQWASQKQMNRAYTGWSSAYSVFTLLLQLQTLVMVKGDWRENHNGLTPALAKQRATAFTCKKCSHKKAEEAEGEFDEGEPRVVWPPLGDVSTELKLEEEDVKSPEPAVIDLSGPPALQPMRCPGFKTTFDKLARLEKSERDVLGWVQLHAAQKPEEPKSVKMSPLKEHGPALNRLPRLSPVWARLPGNKIWKRAVFLAQNNNGTCVIKFPTCSNRVMAHLPANHVRIPEPVQKKFKVDETGKSTKAAGSLDVIRCLQDYSPIWAFDEGTWHMAVLLWQTPTQFKVRISSLRKILSLPRNCLRVPTPVRENLHSQLANAVRVDAGPGYQIPAMLRLAVYTPVFARVPHETSPYKRVIVSGHTRTSGKIYLRLNEYGSKDFLVSLDRLLLPNRVKHRFMSVLRVAVPCASNPMAQLPMVRRNKRCKDNVSVSTSKTSHLPMDICGSSDVDQTSEGGSSTLLEADPMHNIQALFEGDEIIATDKRQGVVVSVGNNNLFAVRFEGESRLTFLTRQKVAYYKRTQTPQGNENIDPTKCYFLELGTTSMFHVLQFCTFKEIARLACVCKDLRGAAEDSFLWRNVFSRNNQDRMRTIMKSTGKTREKLTTTSIKNWKYAFMCEKEQIFQALRCFHTKMNFQETTLGIPLWYTINPKKKRIQYIKSSCDLLGKEAYAQLRVRNTINKERFTDWIPAYITLDHFKRSLPDVKKAIQKLALVNDPRRWRGDFSSKMCLEVFPEMLKTYTVLLADKGIAASEEALTGFCLIHRLFIACCLEWPTLREEINAKIKSFMKSSENRSKKKTPDLGNFIALLSVTDEYSWTQVIPKYIEESMDRSVLWACRKNSYLHTLRKLRGDRVENDRISLMWESNRVGGRLVLFWSYFITKFCRNRTMFEQAAFYDRYFGRPAGADMRQFRLSVKEILKCCEKPNNWGEWFKLMGLKSSNADPVRLTKMFRDAVRNSKKKGYTKEGMNFDRIHSSGVSKILLAGESHSVDPTITKVQVEDIWTYTIRTYLDFSVVALDKSDNMIRRVDYDNTKWWERHCSTSLIMEHSGDVMDDHLCQGQHTMTIHLDRVPRKVQRLVFVVTVWRGDFSRITSAYVRLADGNNNELCCGQANTVAMNHPKNTLAVLGEMRRTGKKLGAQWKFISHTVVGNGTVRNYDNICAQIPNARE